MSGTSINGEEYPDQFNNHQPRRKRNRSATNIHGNSYSYENTANHSPIALK